MDRIETASAEGKRLPKPTMQGVRPNVVFLDEVSDLTNAPAKDGNR